jgi:hypothetical protein
MEDAVLAPIPHNVRPDKSASTGIVSLARMMINVPAARFAKGGGVPIVTMIRNVLKAMFV